MRIPHLLSRGTPWLASLSLCACAAAPEAGPVPDAFPGRIGDAAFLTGVWFEVRGEARVEEYWTSPGGGQMLGAGRDLRGGALASFEHMRIEERDGTLIYVALPRGTNATEFVLSSRAGHELVFENPAHDYPKRIVYRLADDGTLVARTEGDGGSGEEWHYTRAQ